MSRRRRLHLGLAIGVLVTLAAIPVLAGAHTKRFPSEITIHMKGSPSGDLFQGKVFRSPRPFCERFRRVRVIQGEHDAAVVLGTTKTDADGRWEFDPPGQFVTPGSYRAKALRKVRSRPGHRHICRPVSATTTVGGP